MGLLLDFYNSTTEQNQQVYHQPYETYAPVYAPKKSLQMDYSFAPSVQIQSPNATGATIDTKKSADLSGATSSSSGATDTLGQTSTTSSGTNSLLMIALIGGIALVGVFFISRKK